MTYLEGICYTELYTTAITPTKLHTYPIPSRLLMTLRSTKTRQIDCVVLVYISCASSPVVPFHFSRGWFKQSSVAQSPPIICHAPTASGREATRSYPTRWQPRLGENGKCCISKFSLNDITQILLHIKDYNSWNNFSLTDVRLLPQE